MLVSKDCLSRIDLEIQGVVKAVNDLLEDPDKGLEAIFLAGKVASTFKNDSFKDLPMAKVVKYARDNGVRLSTEDRAVIASLKNSTEVWLAGVTEDLNKRIRIQLVQAEESWTSQMLMRDKEGNLRKSLWKDIKSAALNTFHSSVLKIMELFEGTVDRFLQTEIAKFFQHGQVSEVSLDEEIYKVPRPTACPHCMRLHMSASGSPIVYKLRDVQANSNLGKPAGDWRFVLGPVHPHCYCVLYRVKNRPVPGPSILMADARAESLAIGLKKRRDIMEAAKKRFAEALSLTKE